MVERRQSEMTGSEQSLRARALIPFIPYIVVSAVHCALIVFDLPGSGYETKQLLMPALALAAVWSVRGERPWPRTAMLLVLAAVAASWAGDGAGLFFPGLPTLPMMILFFAVAHISRRSDLIPDNVTTARSGSLGIYHAESASPSPVVTVTSCNGSPAKKPGGITLCCRGLVVRYVATKPDNSQATANTTAAPMPNRFRNRRIVGLQSDLQQISEDYL